MKFRKLEERFFKFCTYASVSIVIIVLIIILGSIAYQGIPAISIEFLNSLEECGCVGGSTGWQPAHILLKDAQGKLLGALPLYLKQHSYGEFVFDWSWSPSPSSWR